MGSRFLYTLKFEEHCCRAFLLKVLSPTININITWELLKNVVSQVPPQTYWIRICILPTTCMICILKLKILHDSPSFPYLHQQLKLFWDDTIKYWYPRKVKVKALVSQSCLTLRLHGLRTTRLLCSGDSLGKNTGAGCHSLLQGIFLTQRSNPRLLHCRQLLYPLSHQGSQLVSKPHSKIFWQIGWKLG